MARLLLLVCLLKVLMVEAASFLPLSDVPLLCNSTIDNANASGTFPFTVDFPPKQGSGLSSIPNPAWAVTVATSPTGNDTESTIWYSPAGQNYSNDLALGYDACAQIAYGLPANTVRLAQDDPGDCSMTFSPACRQAIISSLETNAYELTEYASPPPYSNLSAGSLTAICGLIFADLSSDTSPYPQECEGQFGNADGSNTLTLEPIELTGFNTSIMDPGTCTLDGTSGGQVFYNISTLASSQADAYDTYTRDLQVVVSVFFDVANVDRTSSGSPASAQLMCLRPKSFAQGSRVSPALPAGTPYTDGNDLSKGDIAGIVVGAIGFVVVVAAVAWWVWRRRRRGRGEKGLEDSDKKEFDNVAESYELHPRDRQHEVDSRAVHELGSGYWKWVEKDGEPIPSELDGKEKPLEKSA